MIKTGGTCWGINGDVGGCWPKLEIVWGMKSPMAGWIPEASQRIRR